MSNFTKPEGAFESKGEILRKDKIETYIFTKKNIIKRMIQNYLKRASYVHIFQIVLTLPIPNHQLIPCYF